MFLHVHPFVEAYLTKGLNSIQVKWFMKYKKVGDDYPAGFLQIPRIQALQF